MSTKTLPRTRNGNLRGNTDAIYDYWIERLTTPMSKLAELGREREHEAKNSMSYSGDSLMHYGWWTLAEGIRDGRGRTRLVLVNGDRYSGNGFGPSTQQRTMQAEDAARKAGLTVLTVPFSALRAADIDHRSIRPLEILRESYTVTIQRVKLAEVERDLAGDYSRYRRHEDGSISVRDDRHGYQEDVRWNLEHDGDEYLVPHFRHWLGEALFSAKVRDGGRMRTAKFLSAFDHNERRECYFLCELPRTSARTVAEAFDALAPDEVKRALESGVDVRRQGDIFAIPTSMTTRELKARAIDQTITRYEQTGTETITTGRRYNGETHQYEVCEIEPYERPIWEHVPYAVKSLRMAPLLTTNHVATEMIETTEGDVYARGMLRHQPAGRDADHAMIKLGDGKTWYRVLKNTVPLARTRRPNTSWMGPQQSGQSRAWTLGGQVD